MRLCLIVILVLAAIFITACQGEPPTQIILVVTATTDPNTIVATQESASASATPTTENTPEPTATPTQEATSTPDPFPTPVIREIYVAEQIFENGRMFWLQPSDQIWVLVDSENGGGVWTAYDDTFEEGQLESDPNIIPPENLFQPERGFGKLWRENPEVKEVLGWASVSERGFTTTYEYHAGGTVNENNEYIKGDGYHMLKSLYGDAFRLNEGIWTWETVE